jgi:protein-tyrosine phosphatase
MMIGMSATIPAAGVGQPYRVCFVCTGNICRSPMAETVFTEQVRRAGLDAVVVVDSAGTGAWHVGERADRRAVMVSRAAGYPLRHTARQFERSWFGSRDLVVALADEPRVALRRMAPDDAAAARVRLLREFDPAGPRGAAETASGGSRPLDLDVPDPYYGDASDFEHCLRLIEPACGGLLAVLRDSFLTRHGPVTG